MDQCLPSTVRKVESDACLENKLSSAEEELGSTLLLVWFGTLVLTIGKFNSDAYSTLDKIVLTTMLWSYWLDLCYFQD
ncbi:hypothetical protein TNCV_3379521 [Trichonephila clavipes]|nr:hypothetical protein TNCV_3379521 [Trichonephila clavipes]